MKKISLTLAILFLSIPLFAADQAKATVAGSASMALTSTELLIVFLLLFAFVALFALFMLLNALKVLIKEKTNPTSFVPYQAPEPLDYVEWLKQKNSRPNIWTKLLSLKPIEEEESILIPHAYDGIHELNNPVPKWFSILFYGTIIFAASYLYYYHFGDGPRQDQEYATEIEKAAVAQTAFLAKAAEKFDESSIKLDVALIANGKTVFMANCIACHGEHGEGKVGPNLTDEFWLHGGSINDVFKTVKYGVPAKGMASWEKNLSSKNIAEVVNFILSLQGSKPANPKAQQGEQYESKSVKDTVKNESIAKNDLPKNSGREFIYPKKPAGRLYTYRKWVSYGLLFCLFSLPFIKLKGEQLILLNFIERKFVFFGLIFTPQDFFLFALAMLIFMIFIVCFTVVLGRLWCGWACPQTIFMEMVFRRIEYWIEGDANQQKKLDLQGWTTEKIIKKGSKHVLFLLLSFCIANTFLAYIIGSDVLYGIITEPVGKHVSGFLSICLFTFVFYGVFAYVREVVCTVICPYGRLQGVLLDNQSLIVAYNEKRGEPRAHQQKKQGGFRQGRLHRLWFMCTGMSYRN